MASSGVYRGLGSPETNHELRQTRAALRAAMAALRGDGPVLDHGTLVHLIEVLLETAEQVLDWADADPARQSREVALLRQQIRRSRGEIS